MQYYNYTIKDIHYFIIIRYDIIDLIPNNCTNVLEIGCGNGNTLLKLKILTKAQYIAGVDIVDLEQEKLLDSFLKLNIENENLPYHEDFFDVIICGDVLEHLIDPWSTVSKLKNYLKPQGVLIASIPNFREIKNLFSIFFRGDFKYVNAGILDITHLRFFCKKNIVELFLNAGFEIEKVTFKLSPKRNLLHILTLGLLKNFIIPQYLVVAVRL